MKQNLFSNYDFKLDDVTEEVLDSDKPESDQHFNFPIIQVHGPDDETLENYEIGDITSNISNVSHASLESDTYYSDLVFSETPSPVGFLNRHKLDDWR